MQKRIKKIIPILLILLSLTSCGAKKDATAITSIDQLNDGKYSIGVGMGTADVFSVEENLPDAQMIEYSSVENGYLAVQSGMLDAFAFSRSAMEYAMASGSLKGVKLLDDNLGEGVDVVVGISPKTDVPELKQKINAFIAKIHDDGTFDDMYQRWVVNAQDEMPKIPKPEHPDLKITIGTSGTAVPFSFYKGMEITGMDLEMINRFADYANAEIELVIMDYISLSTASEAGTLDCIFANLHATAERKESMDFSDPIYNLQTGIMVQTDGGSGAESPSFFDRLAASFEKNFIREQRWKMIVQGIGTTAFISIFSIIFGTVLGFGICILRRVNNKFIHALTTIYIRILQGTPQVVLLLMLFYLVFPGTGLSGEWVAIIGFTLNFAAYVCEIMRAGIESVGIGQTEAALALGFTKSRAFFKFIMPQAAQNFLPVYKGELISLVKMTSIVGYIAVQDLTKMSDIIRSRTYEAFFPLITTALIYFLLSGLITSVLRYAELKIEPDRKTSRENRVIKGVKMQ